MREPAPSSTSPETARALKPAIIAGLKGRCPKCAQGRLFRAYLKPVSHCTQCNEPWGEVRADDAPAWGTILAVGHILAPIFHILAFQSSLPPMLTSMILASVGVALSLIILPRMKGLFIGLIWATRAPTS